MEWRGVPCCAPCGGHRRACESMADVAYGLQQDKDRREIEEKWRTLGNVLVLAQLIKIANEKETPTMQVTYNGFIGELDKLEREYRPSIGIVYNLSIFDGDKAVTHSFTGVKLEDVKFLGGAVAFGG